MSQIMDELQKMQETVERVRNQLTPEFLAGATKAQLEEQRDEIDNIVKSHHELYDNTNWSLEAPAFILGHESLKDHIGEQRNALILINDQINKLERSNVQGGSQNGGGQNNGQSGGHKDGQGGQGEGEKKTDPPEAPPVK